MRRESCIAEVEGEVPGGLHDKFHESTPGPRADAPEVVGSGTGRGQGGGADNLLESSEVGARAFGADGSKELAAFEARVPAALTKDEE